VLNHIVGKVTGGILAAAVLHGMTDKVQVLLQIYIEGRDRPGALGNLGLLFLIVNLKIGIVRLKFRNGLFHQFD
jgi:hypothetical protein